MEYYVWVYGCLVLLAHLQQMSESVKVSDCRNRRPARDNYPGVIWKPLSSAQVPTAQRKRADDLLLRSVPLQSLKTVMDVSLNTLLPTSPHSPLLFSVPPDHPTIFPFLSSSVYSCCTTLALFVPPVPVCLPSFYSRTFPLFFHSDEEEEERWEGGLK